MSTRAVIAQWKPGTFHEWEGRYHHWDGYPTGLGRQLYHLFTEQFDGDVYAMKRVLIEEHTDWSTICGADWTQPIRAYDSNDYVCAECGAHHLAHYRQYYRDNPRLLPPPAMADASNPVLVLGHQAENPRTANGPECGCHDTDGKLRTNARDYWITSTGDDGGTEWAYVLDTLGVTVFERHWDTGGHMVGMFGQGAGKQGRWIHRGQVAWNDPNGSDTFDRFEQVMA